MQKRTIRIFKFAAIAAVPITLFAFSTGPPIKRTGAPVDDGGRTCTVCHTTFALNDGTGGSVAITASPYQPGVRQNITVRVHHPTANRFGFQLTARLTSEETKEAGTFAESDAIQVRCDPTGNAPCNGALEFAEHRQAATAAGQPGPRRFTIEWTPPATDVGPVVFYAAGNAANNSGNNQGDHIYTTKLIIPSAAAIARPAISENGVQNGASYVAGFAPGGWLQIKGSNLNLNTRIWQESDFDGNKLPTQLDGTSVKINGKDALLYYISPAQINALAPAEDTVGPVSVVVTTYGSASATFTAQIQRLAPAFFLFRDTSIAATRADNTAVGPATLIPGVTTPARPGETITLYGSGFGPTTPAVPNGEISTTPANLASTATIRIGGVDVTPTFAGLAARSAGVFTFTVVVPAAAADGDLPVVATLGGVSSPSGPTIRVQR